MNSTHEIPSSSFTARQEILHSLIHAFGILFGIAGIVFLIDQNESSHSIGFTAKWIYGLCFFITFLFSTLYHAVNPGRLKHVLKILDHISIYFLIAGTYTPFVIIYMNNAAGTWLLSMVWGGALLGIFFKIFFVERAQIVSVCFYVLLGLLFLFDAKDFFRSIPTHTARLIITGVCLYLAGVIFYLWKGWKYHHATWHLFSLAAGLCHFAAVFL